MRVTSLIGGLGPLSGKAGLDRYRFFRGPGCQTGACDQELLSQVEFVVEGVVGV
jgi:hypothetical protein